MVRHRGGIDGQCDPGDDPNSGYNGERNTTENDGDELVSWVESPPAYLEYPSSFLFSTGMPVKGCARIFILSIRMRIRCTDRRWTDGRSGTLTATRDDNVLTILYHLS